MNYPKGIVASLATCFTDDGALDLGGIATTLEFQKKAGVKSVCVLGGTGEAASMTQSERHMVMEETMRHADGLFVMFGALVGRPEEVKADIQKAKDLGADAVMVMAPPFVRPSADDVEKLMRDYASVGIPLVIFNTPSRSAFSMSSALIEKLAGIDGIVGIKESSGGLDIVQDIRLTCPHPFSILVGGDKLYFPTRALGGDGGILAEASVIPEVLVALDQAIDRQDYDTARKCHFAVKKLSDVMYKASHPVPLKLILKHRGLPGGICRPPMSTISAEHEKMILNTLADIKAGLAGVVQFDEEYPL